MKWREKSKKYTIPNDDEKRIIQRFLFFPKCINHEYRWLETVKIKQHYYGIEIHECHGFFGGDSFYTTGGFWIDDEFVDE